MSDGASDAPAPWQVEHHRATAGALHGLEIPDDGRRRIWVLEPTGPAVVLGSTQSDDAVDHEAAAALGIEIVHRRSGGGAVWVAPTDPLWVDVVIPRGDPLWDDDVGRSFLPVGRAWQAALAGCGIDGTDVHAGPMIRTEWSGLVCFAGTGPGEVLREGRKVVGISQRRTRAAARFQCAVPRVWRPAPLRAVLRPQPPAEVLESCGAGVGDLDTDTIVAALVVALG